MIKLIALLGNYGKQYSGTRHNAAWIFAESLSVYSSLNWQKKFKGQFATESTSEGLIYYLKPETYMNLSGDSIIELAHFYKIKPEEILVVHDELELPVGGYQILARISNVDGTFYSNWVQANVISHDKGNKTNMMAIIGGIPTTINNCENAKLFQIINL